MILGCEHGLHKFECFGGTTSIKNEEENITFLKCRGCVVNLRVKGRSGNVAVRRLANEWREPEKDRLNKYWKARDLLQNHPLFWQMRLWRYTNLEIFKDIVQKTERYENGYLITDYSVSEKVFKTKKEKL